MYFQVLSQFTNFLSLQCLNIFQMAVHLRKLSDRLSKVVLVLSITARDALPSSNIAFTPKDRLSSVLFRRKIFMRYHLLLFLPSTILIENNNFRLTRNEAFRPICCKCDFGAPMSGPTMTVATWRVIGLAGDKLGTRLGCSSQVLLPLLLFQGKVVIVV